MSVPAKQLAKAKTVCQQFAVGLALLPLTATMPGLYNAFLWTAVGPHGHHRGAVPVDRPPSWPSTPCAGHHRGSVSVRTEVLAIGTELLLGQIVDTNSSWIGEQLAANGIDCLFQAKVGDNHARIVDALRASLSRADAVLVCGGLGPTHDDITREAIAEVMGVELRPGRGRRGRHPADVRRRAAAACPTTTSARRRCRSVRRSSRRPGGRRPG